MARCILVGAAEFSEKIEVSDGDLVIAADGGYTALAKQGIVPDLLIGDLDSIGTDIPKEIPLLRHPVEKDDTDMSLAYLEGAALGFTDFIIYGGAGGRIDHTLANFSLMLEITEGGGSVVMEADSFRAYIIGGEGGAELHMPERAFGSVSVFAVGTQAHGVSVQGLKYSAENITLKESYALGVSNSFIGSSAKISVSSGHLLIIEGKNY